MIDRRHTARLFFAHEPASTKERLLLEAICLFSERGFEGTTTRMLAESVGANNAAVHFHFGSKEKLYEAVLTIVANHVQTHFLPLRQQLHSARAGSQLSPQQADLFMDHTINALLSLLEHPEFPIIHALILCEQSCPSDGQHPITNTIFLEAESALIVLLQEYWATADSARAALIAHMVVGGLITMFTHPDPIREALGLPGDAPLPAQAVAEIRRYSLSSLKASRP